MDNGFDIAFRHYRMGRFSEAVDTCRAFLAAVPDHYETLSLLGAALFSSGQHAAAADVLEQAVRRRPDDAATLANLATVWQSECQWAAAERCLRALAALDPGGLVAYSRFGMLYQKQGNWDQWLSFSQRAVRLAPQVDVERYNLALARISSGDFAGAVRDLQWAVTSDPGGFLAYAQLGEVLLRLSRLEAATASFRRANMLNSAAVDAVRGLARSRRYKAAMEMAHPASDGHGPGGLVVRGPFLNPSGYSHFCQRFIQGLRGRSVPLQVIGVFGEEAWEAEPLDAPVAARAMLNCLTPLAVERVPGLATVTFTMFEGTSISPAWRRQSEYSDLIIVPCESSRLAWAAQGYPEDRLRVCPLGVDLTHEAPPLTLVNSNGRLVSSYRHRFLNVSDFIPRKNIDGLLRVWLQATVASDDAILILKLGKGGSAESRMKLAAMVQRTEEAVGKRMTDAAPIVVIDQPLDDIQMDGLFRAANLYWSLSHGEGWDLPMSKAGAMGLTLIAPRHSAYVDYLNDDIARMVPASVAPAHMPYSREAWQPFFGLNWWEPDEDAAATILADIISGRDAAPPSAQEHLIRHFTWEQATGRLLMILDEANFR